MRRNQQLKINCRIDHFQSVTWHRKVHHNFLSLSLVYVTVAQQQNSRLKTMKWFILQTYTYKPKTKFFTFYLDLTSFIAVNLNQLENILCKRSLLIFSCLVFWNAHKMFKIFLCPVHINYYFNQNVSVLLETYTALSPLDVSREIQVNTGNKKRF